MATKLVEKNDSFTAPRHEQLDKTRVPRFPYEQTYIEPLDENAERISTEELERRTDLVNSMNQFMTNAGTPMPQYDINKAAPGYLGAINAAGNYASRNPATTGLQASAVALAAPFVKQATGQAIRSIGRYAVNHPIATGVNGLNVLTSAKDKDSDGSSYTPYIVGGIAATVPWMKTLKLVKSGVGSGLNVITKIPWKKGSQKIIPAALKFGTVAGAIKGYQWLTDDNDSNEENNSENSKPWISFDED